MQINRCMKCMGEIESYPCPHCGFTLDRLPVNDQALKPGTILNDRYLIGCLMGQGGFGMTYVAWDLTLERKAAVKEYYPAGVVMRDLSTGSKLLWSTTDQATEMRRSGVENVLKEARKMAVVSDIPEVVNVKDTFQANDTAYIIMDYVEGETLKGRLKRRGPMSWPEAKVIFTTVIRTMARVHEAGLIHRDISPDNIMITPRGEIRILDLGAAKDLNRNQGASSMLVAKRGYSPVEQYNERGNSGPWTDVYAMAATIYYSLTLTSLQESYLRLYEDQVRWDLPQLKVIPAPALNAIRHGMALRIPDRTQSMTQLLNELLAEEMSETVSVLNSPVGPQIPVNVQRQANAQRPTSTQRPVSTREPANRERPASEAKRPPAKRRKKKKSPLPLLMLLLLLTGGVLLGGIMILKPWAGEEPADHTPAKAEYQEPAAAASSSEMSADSGSARETQPEAPTAAPAQVPAEVSSGLVFTGEGTAVGRKAVILHYEGNITEEKQSDRYPFTPDIAGQYRINLSNIKAGMILELSVLDPTGHETANWNYIEGNYGMTLKNLTVGTVYTVEIRHRKDFGSYALDICTPKAAADITGASEVTDSVDYVDQEVSYTFTAPLDGIYRFDLSNMYNGTAVDLCVQDLYGKELAGKGYIQNEGITANNLQGGQTYTILVRYRNKFPEYKLSIGYPKPVRDITGQQMVTDNVDHIGQINTYTFTAPVDGVYRFELSEVYSGNAFGLDVRDYLNSIVVSNSYCRNNEGRTAFDLKAGQTYSIQVQQTGNSLGSYQLNIGSQQPVRELPRNGQFGDSLTYTDQVNVYTLTTAQAGKVTITVSGMQSGNALDIGVYNYLGEEIKRNTYIKNNASIDFEADSGSSYTVRVKGQTGTEYTLNVG